ncbi:Alpha/Beta hydrolase protein [Cyathus striatus]|nr:Alpha/Beta hydrolase protein [Cyathus striatus]
MSCPNCREGSVLPGEPTGSFQADFKGAYFSPAPEGDPKRAIIFLTDGFGLHLKNCKIMADNLAKRLQCDVWVPDYFAGKPLIGLNQLVLPDRAGVKMTIWDWVKFVVAILPNIPAAISSRPSVADKRVHEFIAILKEKKKYEKLGAVGYCFGGSTSIRLGSTGLVNSIVVCHPGHFSLDEVKAINVPAAWLCAEEDLFFSDSHRLKTEAIFAEKKGKDSPVEYAFHHYKGTTHGFAARPNLDLPEIKEAHEKAFEETVSWFEKTLEV